MYFIINSGRKRATYVPKDEALDWIQAHYRPTKREENQGQHNFLIFNSIEFKSNEQYVKITVQLYFCVFYLHSAKAGWEYSPVGATCQERGTRRRYA